MRRTRRTKCTRTAAAVVNYLLDQRGLTARQVADICGTDEAHVERCRLGEDELPRDGLQAVADHLGMEVGAMYLMITPRRTDHPDPARRELHRKVEQALLAFDRLAVAIRERRQAREQGGAASSAA